MKRHIKKRVKGFFTLHFPAHLLILTILWIILSFRIWVIFLYAYLAVILGAFLYEVYEEDRKRFDAPEYRSIKSTFGNQFRQYTRNRSADNLTPYSYSLRRITYPTGGFTEYVYEPNSYYSEFYSRTIKGGGQRIAKLLSYKDPASSPIITEYRYGENESGLGIANFDINHTHFASSIMNLNYKWSAFDPELGGVRGATYGTGGTMMFNINPVISEMSDFSVGYEYVSKHQYSGNSTPSTNGKTISRYELPQQYVLGQICEERKAIPRVVTWHVGKPGFLTERTDTLYSMVDMYIGKGTNTVDVSEYHPGKRPMLKEKMYYNKNGKLVRNEKFTYQSSNGNSEFHGVKILRNKPIDFDLVQWAYVNPSVLPNPCPANYLDNYICYYCKSSAKSAQKSHKTGLVFLGLKNV